MWSSTVCVIPALMKKKSKALDLELTSSSMLIETGGKKMKKLLIILKGQKNEEVEINKDYYKYYINIFYIVFNI